MVLLFVVLMRKIKFRAWIKEEKRMSYSHAWIFGVMASNYVENSKFQNSDTLEVRNMILMQYTGLKAKGKEIYEGDIVRLGGFGVNDPKKIQIIEWGQDNCGFLVSARSWSKNQYKIPATCDSLHGCEIIGNIHENPELLK